MKRLNREKDTKFKYAADEHIACYFINNVNMHLSILVNWNNILLEQVNVLRSFWTLVINLTFKLFSSSF